MTTPRFHWRRLLQFRLRSLLILMAVLAVPLGWWSHKARQQRVAVEAIRQAGGRVWYDPDWLLHRPTWLVHGMGADYFARVNLVSFFYVPVADVNLKRLKNIEGPYWLGLDSTHINDANLHELQQLSGMNALHVYDPQATSEKQAQLQRLLPNCRVVCEATKP